ncbi:MAG: EVE domain-containing protein [Candidatus Zixiibacteriota bacterium]
MVKRYWLFKSEPETFSIQHLMIMANQVSPWDGVRNFQARNFLRDDVKLGDGVFFYHSSTKETGIVGICEVVRAGYPDRTAFDPSSPYFDMRSTAEKPLWYCVDVKFVRKFSRVILLSELKQHLPTATMMVCRRGMRLSIQPVTADEWQAALKLAGK